MDNYKQNEKYTRLYNKAEMIPVDRRILTRGSKACILITVVFPILVTVLYMISLLSDSILIDSIIVYLFVIIPVCIIAIIINVYKQLSICNSYLEKFLYQLMMFQQHLQSITYTINIKRLQEWSDYDSYTLQEYFMTNDNTLKNAKEILNDTRADFSYYADAVEDYIDNAVSLKQLISRKDKSLLIQILRLLNNIDNRVESMKLSVYVTYTSPAGRNQRIKYYNFNTKELDSYLKLLDTLRKEKQEQERHYQEQKSKRYENNKTLELEKALSLFMLEIPFTREQLRKQRDRLLKSFHPDNGEVDATCAVKINLAYKLLQEYTVEK